MNMKLYIPIKVYMNICFYILMFYQLPNYLTFWGPQKLFYLPHEFNNWGHYGCEYLNLFWICGYMHMNYGLPSLDSINQCWVSITIL
jgi:hypothetical protein